MWLETSLLSQLKAILQDQVRETWTIPGKNYAFFFFLIIFYIILPFPCLLASPLSQQSSSVETWSLALV